MYCYAQADEHGLIFSVFQSSLPVADVPELFEVLDCNPLLLGCYRTGDGIISSPPSAISFPFSPDAFRAFLLVTRSHFA